jgi:predicted nicotinamide N-methyase
VPDVDTEPTATNEIIKTNKDLKNEYDTFLDSQTNQPKNTPEQNLLLSETDWKLIIAADCIFDKSHSVMVPCCVKQYLSKDPQARFHVMLPHRTRFTEEVGLFEENMKTDFILEHSHYVEKHTLTFRYYIYKLVDNK